ncbi:FAD-dependent oxidoreductase [Salipiger sp.]|uniref:FAD-dependent oxidoreductase n=1 Tax=Salipiger sp. TaxID=2078585 RepID=UPI003A97DB74
MGAGAAGMSAAVQFASQGGDVLVLEKGRDDKYLCNSRFTGGAMHICFRDPKSEPDVLRAAIEASTSGEARPDMVEAIAQNAGRVLDWLRGQGMIFVKGGLEEYKRWVLAPLRPQRRGNLWHGRGGDVLLRALEASLTGDGGTLRRGARVVDATRAGDGTWEITLDTDETLRARALLIADGGFQANPDMLREHISPKPEMLVQRGAATGNGDGLRIALRLGAATAGMGRFYGHVLIADALERDDLWPYPWLDPIATTGIVVGADGHRFVNETKGGVFVANAIARLENPGSAWVIFDQSIWNGPATIGVIPPNPNLVLAEVDMPHADTVQELAELIGLPAEAVAETVAACNAALADPSAADVAPSRRGGTAKPMPLLHPPFRAFPLVAGITYTMGGIVIDGQSRVLDEQGMPIPGLYAAGTATGGLEGGPNGGYVGGLTKSVATGLLAADHLIALRQTA